ncbi:MAG: HEAT repeat domain-containing protein [Halobacteriota archaeon]
MSVPNVDKMRDQKDIEGLISALKDDDSTVRYQAVKALEELRDLRAVGPLTNTLRDETMAVRARAAEALGRLGDGRAVEPLGRALGDASANVRYTAAEALGALGVQTTVEPLITVLRSDADKVVRTQAARSLGALGDSKAVEPLIDALADGYEDVREAASDALTELLGQRAQEGVKLYQAERDRRQAERQGDVTPRARAHARMAAFCSRWHRNVTLLRDFYSFLDVCEGSLAHTEKPCDNYHCLYNDVMVSGFWLRNEIGVTDFTSKTEALSIMKEYDAVDYTRPS